MGQQGDRTGRIAVIDTSPLCFGAGAVPCAPQGKAVWGTLGLLVIKEIKSKIDSKSDVLLSSASSQC